MMEESATVLKISKNKIFVKQNGINCMGCKSNLFCRNKERKFTVYNNNLEIKEGDEVIIEIKEGKATSAVILTLLFPLLLFFPGYFIGKRFTSNETIIALVGISFVFLGFLLSFIFFHFNDRKFSPILVRKVKVECKK